MTEEEITSEELMEGMENDQQPMTYADVQTEVRKTSGRNSSTVAIVAVIATAVVSLGCIIACAAITIAFIMNAPW